jgi:hypothetical protein
MPKKCTYKTPSHFLYDMKWNHWQIKTTDCICVFQMGIHTDHNSKHFLYNTANHDNLVMILTGYRVDDGDVRSHCQKETQILNLLTASRQALGSIKFHISRASTACGERNYKSSNTHYSFAWFVWPHCLSSPHLQFLICISRCHWASGVFRLCYLGGRQHSWPCAPVSGTCHSFSWNSCPDKAQKAVTLKNKSLKFQFFNPPNSNFSAFLSYRILWTDPNGTPTTL